MCAKVSYFYVTCIVSNSSIYGRNAYILEFWLYLYIMYCPEKYMVCVFPQQKQGDLEALLGILHG